MLIFWVESNSKCVLNVLIPLLPDSVNSKKKKNASVHNLDTFQCTAKCIKIGIILLCVQWLNTVI